MGDFSAQSHGVMRQFYAMMKTRKKEREQVGNRCQNRLSRFLHKCVTHKSLAWFLLSQLAYSLLYVTHSLAALLPLSQKPSSFPPPLPAYLVAIYIPHTHHSRERERERRVTFKKAVFREIAAIFPPSLLSLILPLPHSRGKRKEGEREVITHFTFPPPFP